MTEGLAGLRWRIRWRWEDVSLSIGVDVLIPADKTQSGNILRRLVPVQVVLPQMVFRCLPGVFVGVVVCHRGDVQAKLQSLSIWAHKAIDGIWVGTDLPLCLSKDGRIVEMVDVTLDNAVVVDQGLDAALWGKGATRRERGEVFFLRV